MAASISYTPEPNEQAYYEGLFQFADVAKSGSIGGAQAVQFFARSKLPIDVLKNIWTVADQPSTSSLDQSKFAIAIRLIQLTQNGVKGQGPNLGVPPGVSIRPAFFEGVSGVAVPLPTAAPPAAPSSAASVTGGPPPTPSGNQSVYSAVPPSAQMQMPTPVPQQAPMTAIVPQDPYTMTPQERARYEALFPTYAKPDGFVYGKEAVELFMKSGVDSKVLRELWNLVDKPVDNRLDKLEFAMAMHLIVCISKKNLPPPDGQLPPSLRALKAPPTPSLPPRPEMTQQPPPAGSVAGSLAPPPTGGVSISDAFEGMSAAGSVVGSTYGQALPPQQPVVEEQPSLPSYVPAEEPSLQPQPPLQPELAPMPTPAMADLSVSNPPPPENVIIMEPTMAPTPVVEVPVPAAPEPIPAPSTQELASSYEQGDAAQELGKLKDVLQKLQAENISLKAQLGSVSQEEKDVQKELSATVAEIGSLSSTLQTLRQDVLGAKTKLLEASAQLKAAQEQKGILTSLIGEATETKAAIEEATKAIESGTINSANQQQDALNKSSTFENNLFGYDAGLPPPAAYPEVSETAPQQEAAVAPPVSNSDANAIVTTVSSEDDNAENQQTADVNAPAMFDTVSFPDVLAQPAAQDAPQSAPEYPGMVPVPPLQSEQPVPPQSQQVGPPTPQPSQQYQQYQAPPAYTDPYQLSPPQQPQQQYQAPPATDTYQQPQGGPARPAAIATHSRKGSVGGFGSDLVMGGSAEPSPVYNIAASTVSSFQEGEDSLKSVDELKRKARMAQETADDAAAAHRRLAQEADELRNDADTAEAQARSLRAAADEKKKSRFGGGKKKTMGRDADRAAEDAQEIRKRFMAVQAQAHDAQVVAMETKREAEKLKEEAEEAELQAATAASMKLQQVSQEPQAQAPATNGYPPQQAVYGGYNGYPGAGGYGQQPAGYPPASGGYGQAPAPPSAYPPATDGYGNGYAQPPAYAGYAQPPPQYNYGSSAPTDNGFAGAMGGGGGY